MSDTRAYYILYIYIEYLGILTKRFTLVYLVSIYSKRLFEFIFTLNLEFLTRILRIMHSFILKRGKMLF